MIKWFIRGYFGGLGDQRQVSGIFRCCVEVFDAGVLIERESSQDKEFHFQNWFMDRLVGTALKFEQGGRNSRLVRFTEGYELKGLT